MKPLDPRLLRYARSVRGFLGITVAIGIAMTVLVITQARLLSDTIVEVTQGGATWSAVAGTVAVILALVAGRGLLAWAAESAAFRSGARAKEELREATLAHALALGPNGPAGTDPAGTATLITRGADALDGYFARYLPQLVLAVIAPVAVLVTVLTQDVLSAVIIAVTLPLIPVFMILIGLYTKARVDAQWSTLDRLSGTFLDLVSGLPALKLTGRAKAQAQAIARMGDAYRTATMRVLRVSFLSSLALELLATLSVALVAVSVGLRLAEGQIAYLAALFVLLIAPEAYLPLRLVGSHFHAAAEGLGAADRMLAILETPLPSAASAASPVPVAIEVRDATVTYPGRAQPALLPTTFTAAAGTITAVVGDSGGGKSTLLAALLGFVPLTGGDVRIVGAEETATLGGVSPASWREHVGAVPQHARFVDADVHPAASVRAILRAQDPDAGDAVLQEALERSGIDLPLDAVVAADGTGLSVGQQRRLAIARAILGDPAVLLLDEPTAALDPGSEAVVVAAMEHARDRGAIVIAVVHRPALIAVADQVVRIGAHGGTETAARGARSAGGAQARDAELLRAEAGGW